MSEDAKPKNAKKLILTIVASVLGVAIISVGAVVAFSKFHKGSDKKDKSEDDSYALTMGMGGPGGDGIVDDIYDAAHKTPSSNVPDADSSWTVLVYMCGSNLESGNGFGSIVLDRMNDMTSSDNVNVIVETGGTTAWLNKDPHFNNDAVSSVTIPTDALGRFQIKNNEVIDLGSVELNSMGEPSTLGEFIAWGKANFPAQKYALVLWDHGYSDPYGNLESDDTYFVDQNGNLIYYTDVTQGSQVTKDCLNLDELTAALDEGGVHFESLIFNTCLSSSIEIASIVAPYANYMVASEESIPALIGIPEVYIDYLNTNPTCNGKELGDYICDQYAEALTSIINDTNYDEQANGMFSKSTMACIDLSSASEMWDCYAEVMKYVYYSTYDMEAYAGFLNAAGTCENYGSSGNVEGNLIDLKTFLKKSADYLTDTDADERLITLIEQNINAKNGPARPNSYGMSFFFPSYNYIFNVKATIEGQLIAGGYSYTEDQLNDIVSKVINTSIGGYYDNIDSNKESFWYAAYLDYRMEDYWNAPSEVATAISNYIDDVHQGSHVIDNKNYTLKYETRLDRDGTYILDITEGAEGVVSVEMNFSVKADADSPDDGYDSVFTYFGATSRGVVKDDATGSYYNSLSCEWYYFGQYPVPVYTIEETESQTIYGFRAKVNEEDSIIAFCHDKASDTCKILYACRVEETDGLATNDIFYLKDGDKIDVMFFSYTSGDADDLLADYLLIRPFYSVTYSSDMNILVRKVYTNAQAGSYIMNYTITDAFGNVYYTDFIRYDVTNGSITNITKDNDIPEQVCNDLYGVV